MGNRYKASTSHESALGFRVWQPGPRLSMARAHTHPDIELNWLATGRVEYAMAGRRAVIEAGQLGVFWGGVPHQLIACENTKGGIWLTLPLAWFLRCKFSNEFAARLMTGELISLPLQANRATQWLADFQTDPARHQLVLLELQALFERHALTMPKQPPTISKRQKRSIDGETHMQRITAYLAIHYQELLSIDEIAADLRLHPKYLMAVFRKSAGITIKTYLQRLRLAHAQRLLATTSMSVLDIAMESGFGSLGRFYDAFAKTISERPLQYRKRHRE